MKIELFVPHVAYEVRGLAVSGVVCLCALCALVLWACEDPLDDHRHSHSHSHSPRHSHRQRHACMRHAYNLSEKRYVDERGACVCDSLAFSLSLSLTHTLSLSLTP